MDLILQPVFEFVNKYLFRYLINIYILSLLIVNLFYLDHIPYYAVALDISEILIMVTTFICAIVVICHKHRYVHTYFIVALLNVD